VVLEQGEMSDFTSKARETHRKIAEILMQEWDPIGVAGILEAQDEYDAYVAEVFRLLTRRASLQQLFEYLWWVETVHMALRGDRQRTQAVAERLTRLVPEG
jgi:hypothetical protein